MMTTDDDDDQKWTAKKAGGDAKKYLKTPNYKTRCVDFGGEKNFSSTKFK